MNIRRKSFRWKKSSGASCAVEWQRRGFAATSCRFRLAARAVNRLRHWKICWLPEN
jgi:hypothetical protein